MHQKSPLTGREVSLDDESFIVTKTDLNGIIGYANRTFMQISGYREAELLGQPQNIVRHPDMPKGLFKFMWQQIAAGEECFAYVNNRAKNGDNYWVFANVSPVFNGQRRHTGYFSCRRKPKRAAVDKVMPIYQQMRQIEQHNPSDRGEQSMRWLIQMIEQDFGSYEKFVLGL
ncbi:PAS domain-containing protein [Rheinheimera sp.]|uniref:PAS domain-containing protein n=1 Tax=Rheinheimera sp. TaxID=1869214 RepID=UPI003D27DDEE